MSRIKTSLKEHTNIRHAFSHIMTESTDDIPAIDEQMYVDAPIPAKYFSAANTGLAGKVYKELVMDENIDPSTVLKLLQRFSRTLGLGLYGVAYMLSPESEYLWDELVADAQGSKIRAAQYMNGPLLRSVDIVVRPAREWATKLTASKKRDLASKMLGM